MVGRATTPDCGKTVATLCQAQPNSFWTSIGHRAADRRVFHEPRREMSTSWRDVEEMATGPTVLASHHEAAIDVQRLAGDVTGGRRRQEGDCRGHVLREADAAE